MRIIVCVKQVRHVFSKTGRDHAQNFITDSDTVSCINPFDEAALELALCVKDTLAEVEVLLLSLGPVIAESDLRRCLAMGADELWQIDTGDKLDGWSKSLLLADAAKELEASLILCGEKSLDSQNGQVGPFIASHLGFPFVSRVTEVSVSTPDQPVRVQRNSGRGRREIIECDLPAVFSAAMGPKIPRYPCYKNKRPFSSLPIRKLPATRPEITHKVESTRIFSPRPRAKHVVPPDSSLPAYQRIEQLLQGSSVEKKGEMVKGEPKQQVEKIIGFLKEKEFLKTFEKEG